MEHRTKIAIVGTIVTLIVVAAGITWWLVTINASNKEPVELTDYYQVPQGEILLMTDSKLATETTLYLDNVVYFRLSTIQEMNKRFFWDEEEELLIFTTADRVLKAYAGDTFYYSNKEKINSTYPILKKLGEDFYVALDYAAPYLDCQYQKLTNPDRLVFRSQWGNYLYADVKKETELRASHDKKSGVLKNLTVGESLMFVDAGGFQKNGYVMVMTEDGIQGYVLQKHINEAYYKTVESTYMEPDYPRDTRANSINLAWQLTINTEANKNFDRLFGPTKGLNVISPTWFNVNSEEGTLDCRAEQEYVDRAHELGLEVWGLFSNFHPNAGDGEPVDCLALLSNTKNREQLSEEIVSAALEYGLDGVNIDFESLKKEEGPYFIQFLRELSIKCRQNHLILSVDNYVPANYNAFYDLEEQGKLVDYVIIMGYDEHYVGSDAGSVSSLGFVTDAVKNTLEKVPAERVIMAIPFYTRLWKETQAKDGTIGITSETLGMDAAENFMRENEVSTTWQSDVGQFYGEFEKGNERYRIWLEEELSIEEKMKVISNAGLAGVAEWQLGFERSTIWAVIQKYLR